jgi:hypothetical protein
VRRAVPPNSGNDLATAKDGIEQVFRITAKWWVNEARFGLRSPGTAPSSRSGECCGFQLHTGSNRGAIVDLFAANSEIDVTAFRNSPTRSRWHMAVHTARTTVGRLEGRSQPEAQSAAAASISAFLGRRTAVTSVGGWQSHEMVLPMRIKRGRNKVPRRAAPNDNPPI